MFLKSLTIKGFKSFADSTTLEFEPGVTVVVGPNGSGKSNVVDAVAWVLGAQGPRTVRSTKMEDVIFAGTPKRPALGRAEVSLTIDNSAGLLPIDFSEVTITRTLFRTGESEYAINRVPCRLMDIQDLLSDSGVGRQQHVIVSQGNLDAILNARPEERRLVIEEAAGVLKFRRRKEKSERRLESTEASLVRLQDLLREVRRQLRPLEKQAEAARRHGDLVAELAAVRRYLFGRDLASIESRLAAAARDRQDLGRAEQEVRRALASLDSEVLAAEAQMEPEASRLAFDLGELVPRAEGLRARAGGLVALIGERKRSMERSLAATIDQDVIASLEAEAAVLSDSLSGADTEAAALQPEADALAEAEESLAAESAALEAEWAADGAGVAGSGGPAAEVRGELGALRSATQRSAEEAQRIDARVESLTRRGTRLRAEADRLRSITDQSAWVRPGLDQSQRDWIQAEGQAEEALRSAEEHRREADGERHRWEAREEALSQALDQARARTGAERLGDVGGVVGTLMELVQVDDGYESAFEAAAGEVLAAVIVDGVESARRSLDQLHRQAASGAVLALPDLAGGFRTEVPSPPPGTARMRTRVLGRLPNVNALLDQLLQDVVVTDAGWQHAIDVAIAHPDLVVVTTSGDRCSGGLWQVGAGGDGATGAALEEARRQTELAATEAAQAELLLQEARRAAEGARGQRVAAARAAEEAATRQRLAEEGLERVRADLADNDSELAAAHAHHSELAQRHARELERIAELEGLLPELQRMAEAEAERAAVERAARSRLAERSRTLASVRRELEVKVAGLEERRTLMARRLHEVEERLLENVAERDEAGARREKAQRMAEVTDRLLGFVQAKEEAVTAALTRLREARRAETEAIKERTDRLEQLRRHRSAAERQLTETRERINRIELDETESRLRLEGLTDSIRRDLDCEPEAVKAVTCPELPPGTSATSRRGELERELRLMGPINPLALEEHTALQERHQFLESQLEDVRSARRELAKVIRAIDNEIVEIFGAAYADVAENFQSLFATLFPGGEGRLRLTDPDHLLDSGVEVEARPSGKNLRRLSLLSGGERSLAAMAFLFAVFRARPSPFYMLDEVEAALDDVNLHRFLDLIHEFREEAQLLVVSHQKRTMEAADCLYGVTMAPGGSSRVVSERVSAPAG
jgi:chromosome segregation protein